MKKITIGLFVDNFFPMVDGVAMVVDNYAKRLVKYANVIVFAPEYSGEKYDDSKFDYRVIRCKSVRLPINDYSIPVPFMDKKFKNELKNIKLDIVHIHSPFSIGRVGINYAKKNNVPVIGTMHSQYKMDFLRAVKSEKIASLMIKMIVRQYNRCDRCFAVNSEVARIYHEEYRCKTLPGVIGNATEMKLVEDVEKAREIVNKKYNISDKEKVFLFVGRINLLKNLSLIVRSLGVVKKKNNFKFKMLFVGAGRDENKLKKIIRENGITDNTIICGKIIDRDLLASIYARADLFLFPSLYDASSIVQIEAASQRTPTLFVKGAATASDIINDKNGFICENRKDKYSEKIIEIMGNEELYKTVCDNTYKDLYVNWDDNIDKIFDMYMGFIK